ncbi:hypothetical protein ACU4GD_01150 [Cupriavidus basilensis]
MTPRTYGDILYLEKAVPKSSRRQIVRRLPASLDAGSFVAVLASRPDWYEVEHVHRDGSASPWLDRPG